jgi:phage tail P2-like protein
VDTAGPDGQPVTGLAALIAGSDRFFDPLRTEPEFLPWLAGWVAFTVRADWDEETTRGFLREAVSLYRLRGTAEGLRRMLQIYLRPLGGSGPDDDVVVLDDFDAPEHYFQVRLTLADQDPDRLRATQEMARAIIEQEKPAHTFYGLRVVIPTMRLLSEQLQAVEGGQLLILHQNTWLGTAG